MSFANVGLSGWCLSGVCDGGGDTIPTAWETGQALLCRCCVGRRGLPEDGIGDSEADLGQHVYEVVSATLSRARVPHATGERRTDCALKFNNNNIKYVEETRGEGRSVCWGARGASGVCTFRSDGGWKLECVRASCSCVRCPSGETRLLIGFACICKVLHLPRQARSFTVPQLHVMAVRYHHPPTHPPTP